MRAWQMRAWQMGWMAAAVLLGGCRAGNSSGAAGGAAVADAAAAVDRDEAAQTSEGGVYRGFDRNEYPGDTTMYGMHKTFAFTGYWLTPPPGETTNTWVGKRAVLRAQGWGFLLLANGRLDREIVASQKGGTTAAELGRSDAAIAVAAAKQEGFPANAILFLDQEEGGAMLEEQAAYIFGWTEGVAASGYRAGLYGSGQPVPAGAGKTITTLDDVRARVKAQHLHEIAMFDAQDSCPPAPGCSVHVKPLNASGEPGLVAWQYAQSPRRPEITKSCAATYSKDGNCYAPGYAETFLDMDAAATADPSGGR